MRELVLMSIGMLLFAGCAGAPATLAPPDEEPARPAPDEDTTREGKEDPPAPASGDGGATASWDFSWGAAVGVPGVIGAMAFPSPSEDAFYSLDVPADMAALEVDGSWDCTSPTCTLRVHVYEPGTPTATVFVVAGSGYVAEGHGDGAFHIEVAAPGSGEWMIYVTADGGVAGAAGAFSMTAVPS